MSIVGGPFVCHSAGWLLMSALYRCDTNHSSTRTEFAYPPPHAIVFRSIYLPESFVGNELNRVVDVPRITWFGSLETGWMLALLPASLCHWLLMIVRFDQCGLGVPLCWQIGAHTRHSPRRKLFNKTLSSHAPPLSKGLETMAYPGWPSVDSACVLRSGG